jgi:hypothetical protein
MAGGGPAVVAGAVEVAEVVAGAVEVAEVPGRAADDDDEDPQPATTSTAAISATARRGCVMGGRPTKRQRTTAPEAAVQVYWFAVSV